MYCPECGAEAPSGARFCTDCGHPLGASDGGRTSPDYQSKVYVNKKSEGLALVLSLLIPGLGEIYVGRTVRGVGILAAYAICSASNIIAAFGAFYDEHDYAVYGAVAAISVLQFALWVYAMYDSYTLAKRYNEYLLSHDGNPPPKE